MIKSLNIKRKASVSEDEEIEIPFTSSSSALRMLKLKLKLHFLLSTGIPKEGTLMKLEVEAPALS